MVGDNACATIKGYYNRSQLTSESKSKKAHQRVWKDPDLTNQIISLGQDIEFRGLMLFLSPVELQQYLHLRVEQKLRDGLIEEFCEIFKSGGIFDKTCPAFHESIAIRNFVENPLSRSSFSKLLSSFQTIISDDVMWQGRQIQRTSVREISRKAQRRMMYQRSQKDNENSENIPTTKNDVMNGWYWLHSRKATVEKITSIFNMSEEEYKSSLISANQDECKRQVRKFHFIFWSYFI